METNIRQALSGTSRHCSSASAARLEEAPLSRSAGQTRKKGGRGGRKGGKGGQGPTWAHHEEGVPSRLGNLVWFAVQVDMIRVFDGRRWEQLV